MKVLIQLRSSGAAHQAATRGITAPSVTSGLESAVSGISIDPQYPPVQLPGVQTTTGAGIRSLGQPLTFTLDPARSTYLVRGSIPDGASQAAALQSAAAHPDVVGVFSDPLIESFPLNP